jgi:ABC-2 type transport system permease protein
VRSLTMTKASRTKQFFTPSLRVIFRRELASYLTAPLAFVFIVIFLMLSGFFTFELGNFYFRGQADLEPFFLYHPWLYLFLIPALAMRIWAEERKTGSIELLLTFPLTIADAVVGKFLAAWVFTGMALLLTFPIWITVNYLGHPDNGAILSAYAGSWLMSGAFLSIGCCLSAATRNQVIAFILTVTVCLVFVLAGFSMVLDSFNGWLPGAAMDALAQLSFLTHFDAISRGVLDLRDILFFVVFIVYWLLATAVVIEIKKSG